MNFDVSVIDTLEALDQFVPEWLEFLKSRPIGATALNDPRYVIAQWKSKIQTSDKSTHMIVVIRESEKICCIVPFYSQQQSSFPLEFGFKQIGSIKIKQLGCYGDSFVFRDKGDENTTMFDLVFQSLKQQHSQFDILYLGDVRTNTPLWNYYNVNRLATGISVRKTFQTLQTAYRIRLGNSMEELMASLNKKRRYNIRRTIKKYYEQQAKNLFIKISQPEQVEFLLQVVQQIYDRSWQSIASGTQRLNTERNRLFFQELARQGILRCYILERNGTPIAYRLGVQSGKYFSCVESRYDRMYYAKLYPGIVCLYKHLEELFQENTPEIFDFGLGDYGGYKSVWANDNEQSMTLFLTGSFKGAAIVQTQALLNRIVHFGKRTLDRFGVKEWILNFFKGKLRSSKPLSETNENEVDNFPLHNKPF